MKRLIFLVLAICVSYLANAGVPTIHLCGDSTCAPKDMSKGSPERGWGMIFPNFCDDGVRIINHARNGRGDGQLDKRKGGAFHLG